MNSYIDQQGVARTQGEGSAVCGCGSGVGQDKPGEALIEKASAAPDNWQHRASGMRCSTCMWFIAKALSPGPHPKLGARGPLGRCRRHAPTMTGFPAVFGSDWCGDHKLDEEKSNG